MQGLSKFTDNSEFRTFNDPIRNIQKQNNNFKTVLKVIKLQKREREKRKDKTNDLYPTTDAADAIIQ